MLPKCMDARTVLSGDASRYCWPEFILNLCIFAFLRFVSVRACVCLCDLCVSVRAFARLYMSVCACVRVCMFVYMCLCIGASMPVCMFSCVHVRMCWCFRVCVRNVNQCMCASLGIWIHHQLLGQPQGLYMQTPSRPRSSALHKICSSVPMDSFTYFAHLSVAFLVQPCRVVSSASSSSSV